MIVVRSPFRVSFLGGGSDLPHFYQECGGAVLSTAINRHMFLTGREMYGGKTSLLKYSRTETVLDHKKIQHPIFREVFKIYKLNGLDIGVSSDIPAGSGLGSSSAFTVALLTLVSSLKGLSLSKMEIAELACHIEIELLGETIGKQDQYASAIGGLNLLTFSKNGDVKVESCQLSPGELEWLSSAMYLVEVGGIGRSAGAMLVQVKGHVDQNLSAFQATRDLADLAIQGFKQIGTSGIEVLPDLVNESWRLKRLATPETLMSPANRVVEAGMHAGAEAAKLLGAGGGGFVLFLVNPTQSTLFLESMADYKVMQIRPDFLGASVIYEEENK